MHSNVVTNLPMTFVANLPKLWRTLQFCGKPSCGEPSLWRTFLIPNRVDQVLCSRDTQIDFVLGKIHRKCLFAVLKLHKFTTGIVPGKIFIFIYDFHVGMFLKYAYQNHIKNFRCNCSKVQKHKKIHLLYI